ncbi:MAG: AmmeMemoRadiSam system protein B, partial [Nitrososphaerales archaeon]
PAVAGSFYPHDKEGLIESIRQSFLGKLGPGEYPESIFFQGKKSGSIGCFIVPHAGYVYSGQVAAHSYFKARENLGKVEEELTVIILGPNHYGIGSGVALSPSVSWETPLGNLEVNQVLSRKISQESKITDFDPLAHSREHSIEVQIPFIQWVLGGKRKVSFVPICLMLQDRETTSEVADAIFSALEKNKEKSGQILILGSSDLTHYESQEKANIKDHKLLSSIESMEVREYYTTLERNNVSACGYGAIATVMLLARMFGKKRGQLLKYATSGDVTGDKSSVVGYSAVHFE